MAVYLNQKNQIDCFGLQLMQENQAFHVLRVVPDSFGNMFGFQCGWKVARINNKNASVAALHRAIQNCFAAQNASLILSIYSDAGKLKKVALPVRAPVNDLRQGMMMFKLQMLAGLRIDCYSCNGQLKFFISSILKNSRIEYSGLRLCDQIQFVNNQSAESLKSLLLLLMNSDAIVMKVRGFEGAVKSIRLARSMFLPDKEQLLVENAASKGESCVSKLLSSLGENYIELKNVMLPSGNNRATEIDHVLVCPNGVFAIETKYLSGHVVGSDNEKEWIQYNAYGTKCFFNPVWQNNYSVWALEKLFKKNFIGYPVYSVVVLLNCTYDVPSNAPVVAPEDLCSFILNHSRVIPVSDLKTICNLIRAEQVKSFYF